MRTESLDIKLKYALALVFLCSVWAFGACAAPRGAAQEGLNALSGLRDASQNALARIDFLELQSEGLRESLRNLNAKLSHNGRAINAMLRELNERLVRIHKYGTLEELNLLLSAESAHEAIVSAYLLGRLSRQQEFLMEDLLVSRAEFEHAKSVLERTQSELASRTRELKALQKNYAFAADRTTALLSGVRRAGLKKERAVSDLEGAQKEIAAVVARRRRKTSEKPAEEQAIPYPETAVLEWPLRGAVAGFFGRRTHPFLKTTLFRSGLDIRAAANTLVKAAGPGEVFFEGRHPQWGRLVLIDHGALITVYAYLSSVRVRPGDGVVAGTVLGTTGPLETTEDYGLRFEVYREGTPRNPLEYLRKR